MTTIHQPTQFIYTSKVFCISFLGSLRLTVFAISKTQVCFLQHSYIVTEIKPLLLCHTLKAHLFQSTSVAQPYSVFLLIWLYCNKLVLSERLRQQALKITGDLQCNKVLVCFSLSLHSSAFPHPQICFSCISSMPRRHSHNEPSPLTIRRKSAYLNSQRET